MLRAALAALSAAALPLSAATAAAPLPAPAPAPAPGVCDLFAAGGAPCVAAHSLTRALYAGYAGALYRVLNPATNATADVGVLAAGGAADAASQERFCGAAACVVVAIYDQSPSGNDLGIERGADFLPPPRDSQDAGVEVTARARVRLGPNVVYSAVFDSRCDVSQGARCDGLVQGYSNRTARGTAVADEPQTVYALFDGRHFNTGCCFEYGNAEKTATRLNGSMEAVYYGCNDTHPPLPACARGPYAFADLEHMHEMMQLPGFAPVRLPPADFLLAVVKGAPGRLSLAVADANAGAPLRALYDGPYPAGYESKKQGGIVLGVGGDNSPWGSGTFFEGAMTRGVSSDAADAAVLANIAAAGYARLA